MLVLRRKVGEAIVLNGVITVYVLAVEGERVKLGINAPPDVVIVRQELLDAVAQENRARKLEQQAGEGGTGGEGGRRSSEPPAEGSGKRDLRAMLDRALSTPDGTLPVRNGHVGASPTGAPLSPSQGRDVLSRQQPPTEPDDGPADRPKRP
jgi:carbon storage regulator